jgi:hypothetical protein
MPNTRPWSRAVASLLTTLAVLGALHTVVLTVLAASGARTGSLAAGAALYAIAAARTAWRLQRGELNGAVRWLAVWAGAALLVTSLVGATFHPGPLFWWSAAGAVLTWLAGGVWLGRRVVAEARELRRADIPLSTGRGKADAVAPSLDESLQLTEARPAPAASIAPTSRRS